jgi:hypothetical protein
MNKVRKYLGIIWFFLGIYAGYFSITSVGLPKFQSGLSGNTSDFVFGLIMLFILTPVIVGSLIIFSYYSMCNEYDQ